jgi:hypothetical protein
MLGSRPVTRPRPTQACTSVPAAAALPPTTLAARVAAALASTLAVVLSAAAGCSEPAELPDATSLASAALQVAAPGAEHRAEQARALVDALMTAPGPGPLLAALGQGHAEARALQGPHRLHYRASFSLKPERPERPVVDQPIQQEQQVVDELDLAWGSGPAEPVRMHLSQKTDKGEGREVIILDEQVYTRAAHRGWRSRALDSELHARWLDEAQHCVRDLVELAAPALAIEVRESGDDLVIDLRRADAQDPARIAAGFGREWRQRTEITQIQGSITLVKATGLWRAAELRVNFVVRDALDRPQIGESQLSASVEALPASQIVITAPSGADPVPERVRLELERQRLLGGLAGS